MDRKQTLLLLGSNINLDKLGKELFAYKYCITGLSKSSFNFCFFDKTMENLISFIKDKNILNIAIVIKPDYINDVLAYLSEIQNLKIWVWKDNSFIKI